MKCKNLGVKCDYEEKLKPVEGQGSFKGYDVFQCPKCKEVATTVKKSIIKKADIKKAAPEMCPGCGIEATEGNEVTGFKCPNCDQQPKHHPSNFAHEDLGDNTGLPSRINKFVKGKTYKDAPNYEKKIDRMGPEGGYKRQQGKQEVISASNRSMTDPVLGTVDRFQKTVPDKINKFIAKAEKNVFGDMDKREQAEFYVPGDPDNINYLGFEKHKKGEVSKSIKKSIVKKGKLGGIAGGAIGTGLGYAAASKFGGEHGIPGGRKGRIGGAALGGALGTGFGSMAQDKLKNKDEDEEEKSLDKAADESGTPLYTIKSDDVDIEKFKIKRPSKAAGAAIGGALGAMTPLGPLGAAGGAYLGHKLGKDDDGVSKGTRKTRSKSRRLKNVGSASSGPKVPMAPQHSHVKKAVPGWEVPTYNICPECKQDRPGDENVMRGMKCAACSGMGVVPELCGRIGSFVDKGRDFQTKGERREQTKRPRMPMSGRNTGEVYRNAVEKRAQKPSKKINKAGAPILPCKSCGKPVPHFTSSPSKTKGLCSECIRTSLSKAMWTNQKVCINPQCGWKKGYTKDDPRHATIQQSKSCPQCTKVTRDIPFSPDL